MSEAIPEFSSDEQRQLASVLDEIIPASEDAGLPGAGELGLVAHVSRQLGAGRPAIAEGLAALSSLAEGRGAEGFAALPKSERVEVLNELASKEPGFLPGLIFHTYIGYYQHPRISEALGLGGRPPHPEGYELEEGDLSLLDPVRDRTGLYREV